MQQLILSILASAAMIGSAAAQLPSENWLKNRQAREAAAAASAGQLRQAHSRVDDALEVAADTQLLDYFRLTAALPPSSSGFTPFSASERASYLTAGIEIRVCGAWLISHIRPDGATGLVGWVTPGEVIAAGRLDRVAAGGGIERWSRDNLAAAGIIACALPPGAPALATRWRSPASERRSNETGDWRILPCPAGEVGTGIREMRRVSTVTDGHGTEMTAESADTGWVEQGRHCRAPDSGQILLPVACTGADARESVRIMSYSWTERRLAGNDLLTERLVDWANGNAFLDFCQGGPGEDVGDTVVLTYEYRDRTCTQEHGPQSWVNDSRGPSDARHRREKRTSTLVFPASWNRPDATVVSYEPWERYEDDCRTEAARTDSKQTGGCSGTSYTRRWIDIVHVSPLPPASTYIKPGSDSGWVDAGQYDNCPSGNGGGGDDDDSNWRDSRTGIVYRDRPPGSRPEDGHAGNFGGWARSSHTWESDRDRHDDDD